MVERRLPTRIATALQRLFILLGFRHVSVVVADASFVTRRLSSDRFFIDEVFGDRAYCPPGYEIAPSDVIVDVGANIGAFTVFAALQATSGRVISLEPVATNFSLLRANVQGNGLSNVQLVHAGVASQHGKRELFLSDLSTGRHSLYAEVAGHTSRREVVQMTTIEELFAAYGVVRCDYLKLDCEGAEFEILTALDEEVARRIRRVGLEYHCEGSSTERECADILLARLRYLRFTIDRYTEVTGTHHGMIFARRMD